MTVDENLYNDKIINHVFGGAPTGEVLDAFKKIKFTVLDITDKENVKEVNAEAVLGNLDRMSLGSYYINNLEKGKKYVIQVQLDSIPDGYFYYFEKFENGSDQPSTAFLDPTKLKDGVIVDTDQMGNNLFGHIRLHLRVMDVIFAKDKETAEHIYNFKEWVSENDGQTYWDILSWNKDLKEGVDYKKACVNKDRSVTIPEGFQKEGYKPLGWVFSYDGWKDQSGKAKEFSFEGMLKSKYFNQFGHPFQEFRTDTGINSIDAVLKAHSYSVYLKSMLPEVTFNYNFANDQGDTLSQKQNVFYGKSFSNNKTTTEELPNIEVTPEREGYVFLGWNTSSDGSGDTFDANTIVNDNLTVYAMWAKSQSATATVIDQDGAGLKGQTVEVYDADDAHVGTITTDERGLG
ncbi:InlB B-repeat-containing protein, partial [Allofustis seminis]|uniref:InlB B-repeat-containing protein n=1 Tax=Allofustis seminis TaxID=166939 RepID=UPI000592A504